MFHLNRPGAAALPAVLILGLCLSAPTGAASLDDYLSLALQGDISPVVSAIRDGEITAGSSAESTRVAWIRERFVDRVGPADLGDLPPVARDLLEIYREDWTTRLLAEAPNSDADSTLAARLRELLREHRAPAAPDSVPVWDHLDAALLPLGIHHIAGITRPHRDLIAWTRQDTTHYEVELTDRTQPVDVVFLSDFVSYGWMHYATFGRAYPGGWATTEALFCFRDDYDLESEKFLVSYLKHEARHYADYVAYPALEQTDLEYRAKLTELAFAEETAPRLLAHFEQGAARNPESPHAFANWALISDLRATFPEAESLTEVPRADLQTAARTLLHEHDAALSAAGAETTKGVVEERAESEAP